MKKIGIAIALLGSVLLGFYLNKASDESDSTLDPDSVEFAIEDPDEVTAIFMANKKGDYIHLTKISPQSWVVNDTLPAWQKQVDILLRETMPKISVKGVVHENARTNVINRMASLGIKVEIFTDNAEKPSKVYFVGGTTPDQLGTYFWMEGARDPMILDLPGMDGFVNTRYNLNLDDWISRNVIRAKKDEIASISLQYPMEPEKSFTINVNGDEASIEGDNPNDLSINQGALRSYLNLFGMLNYESFDDSPKHEADSILAQVPMYILSVTKKDGESDTVTFYPKGSFEGMRGLYDREGNRLAYDPERYFAKWSDLDRLLVVQDYTFRKVLVTYQDFLNRL